MKHGKHAMKGKMPMKKHMPGMPPKAKPKAKKKR